MRLTVRAITAAPVALATCVAPPAHADAPKFNYPSCTLGIEPDVVLGPDCDTSTYYAFGVTSHLRCTDGRTFGERSDL